MSCIFMSCNFIGPSISRPSFSRPAFSAPPFKQRSSTRWFFHFCPLMSVSFSSCFFLRKCSDSFLTDCNLGWLPRRHCLPVPDKLHSFNVSFGSEMTSLTSVINYWNDVTRVLIDVLYLWILLLISIIFKLHSLLGCHITSVFELLKGAPLLYPCMLCFSQ